MSDITALYGRSLKDTETTEKSLPRLIDRWTSSILGGLRKVGTARLCFRAT